jgi:hypothetical protein
VDLKNVTLNSTLSIGGTAARLTIGDDNVPTTLSGNGQLTFNVGSRNLISLYQTTIGPGITIATGTWDGELNLGNGTNLGTIRATAGHTLGILPQFGINQGLIQVDTGGTLAINGSWPIPSLGTVVRSPGSTIAYEGVYNNTGNTMDLTSTAVGPVDLGSVDITGGTITSPGRNVSVVVTPRLGPGGALGTQRLTGVTVAANLTVQELNSIHITGGFALDGGSIALAGKGSTLLLEGSQTISGTGDIVLDHPLSTWDGYIGGWDTGNIMTLAPGIRVRTGAGSGMVGGNGSVLNYGTISAETAGQVITLSTLTNHGTVQAIHGGTLSLPAPWTTDNPIKVDGGIIRVGGNSITAADIGSIAFANDAKLMIVGTYNNANAALVVRDAVKSVVLAGNGTLSGGTLISPTGDALQVEVLPYSFSSVIFSGIQLNGPVNCQPGTSATLMNATNNAAFTTDHARLSLTGTWANAGSISAINGATLILGGTPSAIGSISATDSGISLGIPSNKALLDSISLSNSIVSLTGTFDNTGTTLIVDPGNSIVGLSNGGTIKNGTVSANDPSKSLSIVGGTLDGVTLAVGARQTGQSGLPVKVRNGLTLVGGTSYSLAMSGQLPFGGFGGLPEVASLLFNGTQTLSGSGELVFDVSTSLTLNKPPAIVLPTSGSTLTFGPGITLRTGAGGGELGIVGATIVNDGTIQSQAASVAGSLPDIIIDGAFTNRGTLRASGGGKVSLATTATLTNLAAGTLTGGTYQADDNSTLDFGTMTVTTNAANVLLAGPNSRFDALAKLTSNAGYLNLTAGRNFTAVGDLSNSGALVVGDGSTLTVLTGHTLTNTGTISGNGTIVGTLTSSGTISPGASPGLLTISGDLTEVASSVLDIEIGEAGLPRRTDALIVTGSAHIAGTLSVHFYAGYQPPEDDPITLNFLQTGSINGAFSDVELPPLPEGMTWDQSRVGQGVLVLVPEPSAVVGAWFVGCLLAKRRRRR